MAYSPTAWINNSEPAITAEKLNKMEFGIASAHGIAEAKASTDYVQGQVAAETNARIDYVTSAVGNLEAQIDETNSQIVPVIESEMSDPTSTINSYVSSTAINSVDTNWSLSTLTTNLESEFGDNASNITTKLATYAQADDVGAIAQVALDVDGRITGWTAVDSTVSGSAFKINADTFALSDANNEHTPFSIDAATGLTQFNGIVQFSNVTGTSNLVEAGDDITSLTNNAGYTDDTAANAAQAIANTANTNALARPLPSEVAAAINNNTTTINGSKITTGSLSAAAISTDNAFIGHKIQSTNYDGVNGFRLNANATGTSDDPTIYGSYIKGAVIEGSTFVGALSKTTSFNDIVYGLPVSSSLGLLKTLVVPAPTNGAYKLLISASLVPIGGNYPITYYDIRVNGVSLLGVRQTTGVALGSGGSYNRTMTTGEYSSAVTITIYGRQESGGFAYAATGTDMSISAIGVA